MSETFDVKDLMDLPVPEEMQIAIDEAKKEIRAHYGENRQITDYNYDKILAVKCVNGTFVCKKT